MKIVQKYHLNRLLGVGISGHWEVKFVLIPIIFFLPDVGKFWNGGRMEVYLTIEELAAMLKLSEQTIRRYVLNKTVPYRKIKKAVRFRLSEIEKWIDGGCADNFVISDNAVTTDEADGGLLSETSDLQNIGGVNKGIL